MLDSKMAYDLYGNEIIVDMLDETHEAVEAWNVVANACVAEGLGYFISADGARVCDPTHDELGRILWRVIAVERQPTINELTIGDRSGPPSDAMDQILCKLPMASSKRTKAAALLMGNFKGPDIAAKLRVSHSTITNARAALLREFDERLARGETPDPLPESITNPTGLSNRGQSRPDMKAGSGSNPFERRAEELGISVAEARAMAADAGRIARYGERPKDLKAAAKAREYRERKRRERASGDE